MIHAVVRTMPLAVVVIVATVSTAAAGQAGQPGFCQFSVVLSPPFRDRIGPEAQWSRVRLVSQPDSPIAVTRLWFPMFLLPVPRSPVSPSVQMPYTLSVMNVSDKFVRSVQLYVQLRTPDGLIAVGPKITRALGVGESAYIRRQDALGNSLARAEPDEVYVLVAVESVEFGECVYRPSQAAQAFEKP
jgi:hypothetical protein